jgi:plastocyanin
MSAPSSRTTAPARTARPRLLRPAIAAAGALVVAAAGHALAADARTGVAAPRPTADTREPAVAPVTHRVRMIGDERGYRFEPATVTVDPGDRVAFVLVSGAPHNVQFDEASVPEAAKARLAANMPDAVAPLMGPMLMAERQAYTVSFAGVPAGTYKYICTPHVAMQMTGTIVVRSPGRRPAAKRPAATR